jgi:hypothetical protein
MINIIFRDAIVGGTNRYRLRCGVGTLVTGSDFIFPNSFNTFSGVHPAFSNLYRCSSYSRAAQLSVDNPLPYSAVVTNEQSSTSARFMNYIAWFRKDVNFKCSYHSFKVFPPL